MPETSSVPWLEQCRLWVRKYDPVGKYEEFHHYAFMRALSEKIPANAIIVADTGGNVIMMGHCFQSKSGQRIFASNGNTPMGFALCGAIGAWFAEPSRPIVCIIGDGGMSMNVQELQTVKHYNIPLKLFVINNHCLVNTKAWQRVNKRAEIACGPDGYSCPDFIRVANAYGIPGMPIGDWEHFDYVDQALAWEGGAILVDVVDHDRCNYEPRISRFDLPIEDAYPFLPREEFRENMIVEPWEGWEKNT